MRPALDAPSTAAWGELTARETEVALAIGAGCSNREIAERLRLTESTVKSHVNRVLGKLALRDRLQVAVAVWMCGLLTPPIAGAAGVGTRPVLDGRPARGAIVARLLAERPDLGLREAARLTEAALARPGQTIVSHDGVAV